MKYGRAGALAGTVYVVFVLVGSTLELAGLDQTNTAEAILANLQRPPSAANIVGFVLEVSAFLALAAFIAYTYRLVARAEGPEGWLAALALSGGLLDLIVKVGSAAPMIAAQIRKDDISAEAARTLIDLNSGAFVVSGLATGFFVAALSAAARSGRVLGGRSTAIGLTLGTLAMIAAVIGVIAPASYFPLAFVACLLWIAVTGVILARAEVRTPAALVES